MRSAVLTPPSPVGPVRHDVAPTGTGNGKNGCSSVIVKQKPIVLVEHRTCAALVYVSISCPVVDTFGTLRASSSNSVC